MHKDINDLLSRSGLREREGRIYLACLRHKDGLFIHEITRETRIGRSTVDLAVARLIARGFLDRVKSGKRFRFFAKSPEAILLRQKQLAEDWEHVLPILTTLGGQKKDMEVLYFEGALGVKQVYDDILLNIRFAEGEKKHLCAFSSGVDILKLFPNMQKAFIDKRIRNGSWYRAIATQEAAQAEAYRDSPKALRAIKYMPTGARGFTIDIIIYADCSMMYSPVKPVGGAIIRNEKIADAMRSIFYLMWGLLPEEEKGKTR